MYSYQGCKNPVFYSKYIIKPNINDNEIFFKTTSVTLLSTSVNNETNTETVLQYFGIFYAKTKGFRIICRNIQCMSLHIMVKSMNFDGGGGGGGGAESLHYYALKQTFPYEKITSLKTCHAWSVKKISYKIVYFLYMYN